MSRSSAVSDTQHGVTDIDPPQFEPLNMTRSPRTARRANESRDQCAEASPQPSEFAVPSWLAGSVRRPVSFGARRDSFEGYGARSV